MDKNNVDIPFLWVLIDISRPNMPGRQIAMEKYRGFKVWSHWFTKGEGAGFDTIHTDINKYSNENLFFSHRKLYSAWFLRVAAFYRCITSLWYFVIWCIQSTYSMGEEGGGVQQTRGRVCDRYRVKGIQCNSFTVRNRVRVSDSTLQKQLLKNWASTLTFSIMNDVIETVIPDSTSE